MDPDGDEEDGGEGEEDDGVDEDGGAAGLEVAELDEAAALCRQLQQQPRREQHEQHHRHHHRPPVRHLSLALLSLALSHTADAGEEEEMRASPRRAYKSRARPRRRHTAPNQNQTKPKLR